MTNSEIESFLAICRYKTVSGAAESLYITQSSLSIRLKALEKKVGGMLFYRRKGSRKMILTAAGRQFYALSLQYESLLKQMRQVCKEMPASLRVSSLNSVDTFLLPAVYTRFSQSYPDIKLEIQDMDRPAASISIQNGDTDLAFTSGKNTCEGVRETPVFIEPMVLICSGTELQGPVRKEDLSAENEVYIGWSLQFMHWHQQTFGDALPRITVSIMPHLQQFMARKNFWSIVPVSVAIGMAESCQIRQVETAFPLPTREMSILSAADAPENAATLAFYDCLREALAAYPQIKVVF